MASILSKPKAPDTSAQEARLAAQDAALVQREQETARKQASMQAARSRRSKVSLITGAETGVSTEARTTLG